MNDVFLVRLVLNPEQSEVSVHGDVFIDQRKMKVLDFLTYFEKQLSEAPSSVKKKFNCFNNRKISNYDETNSLRSYKNFCITSDEDFIEELKNWACEFSYAQVIIDKIIIEELEPLS